MSGDRYTVRSGFLSFHALPSEASVRPGWQRYETVRER